MVHDLKERFYQKNKQILIEESSQHEKNIHKVVAEINRTIKEKLSRGENYHTGGIVGKGQMPTLHVGGLASQFVFAPLHNEIDIRMFRNDLVLTETQQVNLMRMIDAVFTRKDEIMVPKYRKKPVVIEAIQFNNLDDYLKICKWIDESESTFSAAETVEFRTPIILVNTLEGTMAANPGDYIIKGVNGEFYPCKPDIFEKTYEALEE